MSRLLISIGLMLLASQISGQTSVSVQEAIAKKMIGCKISGAWDRKDKQEFLDGEGQYFGRCMSLRIKSRIDSSVRIYISNGLMLMCEDTATQDMIITKPIYVELQPGEVRNIGLYAMCSEIHDGMPHVQTAYMVGNIADKNLVSITRAIDAKFMHNIVGQGAVWAYTDNATEEDLRGYGATDNSLQLTIDILNQAGVATMLNPPSADTLGIDSAIEPAKVSIPPGIPDDDNVVSVNASLFYSACGIIITLLASTVYLLIRNRRNRNNGLALTKNASKQQ